MSEKFEWAKKYFEMGWKLYPVHTIIGSVCSCGDSKCKSAGKHPVFKKNTMSSAVEISKLQEWFDREHAYNVGIYTGEVSDLTVIDIDMKNGGVESWQEIIKEYGEPETLKEKSGGGGFHLYFRYNSALKTGSSSLGEGIEIKNDGGTINCSPSTHESGKGYEWINWGAEIKPVPKFLATCDKKILKSDEKKILKSNEKHDNSFTLQEVEGMLEVVDAKDRDLWRKVGIILGRCFEQSDEAWNVYQNWADKYTGEKDKYHEKVMREAFYTLSTQKTKKMLGIGSIVAEAMRSGWQPDKKEMDIENFIYYAPKNNFIYRPTSMHWVTAAVDSVCSKVNIDGKLRKATKVIKETKMCSSICCDPIVREDYKKGYDNIGGEILKSQGGAVYNTYRKPEILEGDARLASPFLDHVYKVFSKNGDAHQFLNFMAHRVQKAWVKPRFSLLIAGEQGVGKDTCVDFCINAIGQWNVANIGPKEIESQYNAFVTKTLIRISELSAFQESNKFAINEQMKNFISGNPDFVLVNPKFGEQFITRLFCGVIITTNNLRSGIYIPEDDRKYDVIEAATIKEMGFNDKDYKTEYFNNLWAWFKEDGFRHVNSFLLERDISGFSAENGQRKTKAHREVVLANQNCDLWLEDILDEIDYKEIITSDQILSLCEKYGQEKSKVSKKLASSLARKRYRRLVNKNFSCGRYKIGGKKVFLYICDEISDKEADEKIKNVDFLKKICVF